MLPRLAALALLGLPLTALAQPAPQPFFNVVTLDASATSDVSADTLTVTMFTEETGPDPAALAARANTRLEQALGTAKSDPGVEARSGSYQTTPVYDRAGQITGWRVRAELVIEGVRTTVPFHQRLLADPQFRHGGIHTQYVQETYAS